jgi:hypothetical protein
VEKNHEELRDILVERQRENSGVEAMGNAFERVEVATLTQVSTIHQADLKFAASAFDKLSSKMVLFAAGPSTQGQPSNGQGTSPIFTIKLDGNLPNICPSTPCCCTQSQGGHPASAVDGAGGGVGKLECNPPPTDLGALTKEAQTPAFEVTATETKPHWWSSSQMTFDIQSKQGNTSERLPVCGCRCVDSKEYVFRGFSLDHMLD